jgi:demethylmenaquinone methyltransferase/2-methoxy-6-polyprenyl-1,4-benzoquinol methylase
LEFGKINEPKINQIYQIYSQNFIPKIGEFVTGNKEAYKYLIQSIKKFPKQEVLSNILLQNGFKNVSFKNLSFGIVTIYSCNK